MKRIKMLPCRPPATCIGHYAVGDMDNDHQYVAVADDAATTPQTLDTFVHSDTVKTASALALTYHGYKRTGSLLWALLYGAAGRFIPTVAVPVAVAQGFGKKRTCTTE